MSCPVTTAPMRAPAEEWSVRPCASMASGRCPGTWCSTSASTLPSRRVRASGSSPGGSGAPSTPTVVAPSARSRRAEAFSSVIRPAVSQAITATSMESRTPPRYVRWASSSSRVTRSSASTACRDAMSASSRIAARTTWARFPGSRRAAG